MTVISKGFVFILHLFGCIAMRMGFRTTFVAALMVPGFGGAAAVAEEIIFVVESQHPNVVELEFHTDDGEVAWPGSGEAFILDDYETKVIPLICKRGQLICYGAWVSGDESTYWGVGANYSQDCEDCCYECGVVTESIILTR